MTRSLRLILAVALFFGAGFIVMTSKSFGLIPISLLVICVAGGIGLLVTALLNIDAVEDELQDIIDAIPYADGSIPTPRSSATSPPVSRPGEQVAAGSRKARWIVFGLLFLTLFLICFGLMVMLMAQNGRDLFAPEMRMMLLGVLAVSAYVGWRISSLIARRLDLSGMSDGENRMQVYDTVLNLIFPTKIGMSALNLTSGGSSFTRERRAKIEALRRKLIAEGKLDPSEVDTTPDTAAPVRVAKTAPIKDRMAARAERVRRAKEQGKLD